MKKAILLSALLIGSACMSDESVAKYGAAGKTWALHEIDGAPFSARTTLEFDKAGWITGQAPCNRFSAKQTAPYPWFKTGPAIATKMACQDLKQEQVFFEALGAMSLSEVSGAALILSNDDGRSMIFKAQ